MIPVAVLCDPIVFDKTGFIVRDQNTERAAQVILGLLNRI